MFFLFGLNKLVWYMLFIIVFTKLPLIPMFEFDDVTPINPFLFFLFRVFEFCPFFSMKSFAAFLIPSGNVGFLFAEGIFFFLKIDEIEFEPLSEVSFIDCLIF